MTIENPADVLERALRRVREENEQLKKQLDYLRSGKYLNQVKWERDFNERMVEDLQNDLEAANSRAKELSGRIIKAIEFICKKDMEANLKGEAVFNSNELLEILKGSDN